MNWRDWVDLAFTIACVILFVLGVALGAAF